MSCSTKCNSEAIDARSEPEVQANMVVTKDELQYCMIEDNVDSDQNINLD